MSLRRVKMVSSVGALNLLCPMEVALATDTEAGQVLLLQQVLGEGSHQVDSNLLEGIYLQLLDLLPMRHQDRQHHFFMMDMVGHALIV